MHNLPSSHPPVNPIFLPVKKPSPRILSQAVCLYLGIDPVRVFEPCRRATGSITEACVLLLQNLEPASRARATRAAATSRADAIRPDSDNIPPRVMDALTMLRKGWRPSGSSGRVARALDVSNELSGRTSGRMASALDAQREGACDAPLRLILLYISPPSYTLGIQAADGAYIPIGKVDRLADLHPDERAKLRKRARALVMESFGPTSLLKPEIVVEATYSHIEINTRTKAGKVLRNVAITRICWDDSIESIAVLESL